MLPNVFSQGEITWILVVAGSEACETENTVKRVEEKRTGHEERRIAQTNITKFFKTPEKVITIIMFGLLIRRLGGFQSQLIAETLSTEFSDSVLL